MFGGGVLHSETVLDEQIARPDALGEQGTAEFHRQTDQDWITCADLNRIAAPDFNTR